MREFGRNEHDRVVDPPTEYVDVATEEDCSDRFLCTVLPSVIVWHV